MIWLYRPRQIVEWSNQNHAHRAHRHTHTLLKVYNKAKTKQVGLMNTTFYPNVKRVVLVSPLELLCLINMCDSTTVKRDECNDWNPKHDAHFTMFFTRFNSCSALTGGRKGCPQHSKKKNSITHQLGVVITAYMFGCESACAMCEVLSLQSCELCVGGGSGDSGCIKCVPEVALAT